MNQPPEFEKTSCVFSAKPNVGLFGGTPWQGAARHMVTGVAFPKSPTKIIGREGRRDAVFNRASSFSPM